MAKVLLVDDEEKFRTSLARRMNLRGYETSEVDNGEDAVKRIRADGDIDVVLLDRTMPGMSGEQALKEMKSFRPELQVIILTGQSTLESAMETGRLEAYSYLRKPYDLDDLLKMVDRAREDKVHAMARHEIVHVEKGSFWKWLVGSHNSRPLIIGLGIVLFCAITFMPTPDRMLALLSAPKTGEMTDANFGYASYRSMTEGQTIADAYSKEGKVAKVSYEADGKRVSVPLTPEETATKAKIMLAVLVVAALFWASGAVPVGISALIVALAMYFGGVMPPDYIAQSFAKDSVIFIFGVLAISSAISKTGLDRRIGLLMLGPARNLPKLLFLFLPLLGMACSFVSEHALIAFLMPLFMVVYTTAVKTAGIRKDRALAVMFVLSMTYVANSGGPGSPAAGGRNAVMMSILGDYGLAPTFGQWVMYGLPFVPVMALVIATYFYLVFRKKLQVKNLDVSTMVRQASEKIGPMNGKEYVTATVLVVLIALWVLASDIYGMGGPVVLAIVALNIFRVLRWRDIASIPWDVVALYAAATAMGKGLAITGAALYLADSFVSILPIFLRTGEGLAMAASLFTGIATNFMSDGATVSAIGPITIPMAKIAGSSPLMVGLATAFASSFAHTLIIGTPNNAICYALAKDPYTGEQLVTLGDFIRHGAVVLVLSFAVLWLWTFYGYWRWIGF
ncbi:MAG: SLC13 family permease [candidate division Zixibacteria bacterium]|jgi:sodium-dependent dicarboxylate transporter 2/3/5|nr:SLC13 family permease [candidate division Zixibacteria bacterium]